MTPETGDDLQPSRTSIADVSPSANTSGHARDTHEEDNGAGMEDNGGNTSQRDPNETFSEAYALREVIGRLDHACLHI